MLPWLQAWLKVKLTSNFQQIYRLLTVEIVVLKHTTDSDSQYTYNKGFYIFMHVSYTFAEAELVKAELQ